MKLEDFPNEVLVSIFSKGFPSDVLSVGSSISQFIPFLVDGFLWHQIGENCGLSREFALEHNITDLQLKKILYRAEVFARKELSCVSPEEILSCTQKLSLKELTQKPSCPPEVLYYRALKNPEELKKTLRTSEKGEEVIPLVFSLMEGGCSHEEPLEIKIKSVDLSLFTSQVEKKFSKETVIKTLRFLVLCKIVPSKEVVSYVFSNCLEDDAVKVEMAKFLVEHEVKFNVDLPGDSAEIKALCYLMNGPSAMDIDDILAKGDLEMFLSSIAFYMKRGLRLDAPFLQNMIFKLKDQPVFLDRILDFSIFHGVKLSETGLALVLTYVEEPLDLAEKLIKAGVIPTSHCIEQMILLNAESYENLRFLLVNGLQLDEGIYRKLMTELSFTRKKEDRKNALRIMDLIVQYKITCSNPLEVISHYKGEASPEFETIRNKLISTRAHISR